MSGGEFAKGSDSAHTADSAVDGRTVVFVAGYGNSGGGHWQRLWHEAMPGSVWVEQDDWESPECGAWVACVDDHVRRLARPFVFVAHSLGCLAVEAWSRRAAGRAAGAMLVAPPDPEGPAFPAAIRGFRRPAPRPLGFPCVVVASSDDPYATCEWSRARAGEWHAELIEVGRRGHINAGSGLGAWPDGRAILARLRGTGGEA
jgi:predicted alpha/beta hydrolase family esterase